MSATTRFLYPLPLPVKSASMLGALGALGAGAAVGVLIRTFQPSPVPPSLPPSHPLSIVARRTVEAARRKVPPLNAEVLFTGSGPMRRILDVKLVPRASAAKGEEVGEEVGEGFFARVRARVLRVPDDATTVLSVPTSPLPSLDDPLLEASVAASVARAMYSEETMARVALSVGEGSGRRRRDAADALLAIKAFAPEVLEAAVIAADTEDARRTKEAEASASAAGSRLDLVRASVSER
jgi:hypothetical protein